MLTTFPATKTATLIISSLNLYNRLTHLKKHICTLKEGELVMEIKNNQLRFKNEDFAPMHVEVEPLDDFETTVSVTQINKLHRLLGAISEQPIVLSFEKDGWIHVKSLII